MTDVPGFNPVTNPLVAPTAAIPGDPLVHVPPEVVLVHVWDEPVQIGVVPVMVCETGVVIVTVFDAVLTQPPVVVTE